MADLKDSNVLKYFNFANIYEKRHVCAYCKSMYDKLDHLRVQSHNETNAYLSKPELIPKAINDYMAERDNRFKAVPFSVTKHFSNKFFYDLQFFDLPRPEPERPQLVPELLPEFNQRMMKRKEKIMKSELRERNVLSETAADFKMRKANEISLKLHLGAKEKIPVTEIGAITTQASLRLAILQSVVSYDLENERTREDLRSAQERKVRHS